MLPAEILLANKSAHSVAGNRYDRIVGLTEKVSRNRFARCLMLITEQQTGASALACHAIYGFGRTVLDSDPACLTGSDSGGTAGALLLLSPRDFSEGKFPKEEGVMVATGLHVHRSFHMWGVSGLLCVLRQTSFLIYLEEPCIHQVRLLQNLGLSRNNTTHICLGSR